VAGFIPIFTDWIEVTRELNDQEKGRLVDAMVMYARGENWQERIKGNERYVFPNFRCVIDRSRDITKKRAESGKRGGKQKQANRSKRKQNVTNVATPTEEEEEEEKEKEYNTPYNPPQGDDGGGFFAKLRDLDVRLSADAYEEVRDFMEQGITDAMLSYAADLATDQNRLSWAYIRGIVNNWITEGVETLQQAKARKREEPEIDSPHANVLWIRSGDENPYKD